MRVARGGHGAALKPRARRPIVGAAASGGGPPLLYVDALNFQSLFFDGNILERRAPGQRQRLKSGDLWRDVACCKENVGVFMREARTAGWQVTVFLDMVKDREDEICTWWKRKAASMQQGGTSLIPFAIILLGSFFEAEGASVRYAAATDNDPTLAAFANLDDAAVLSADGDFLRYFGTRATGERYFLRRLYSGFSVGDERNDGKLALWEKCYSKQLRDKSDWQLTNGVGEYKGGLEKFLPSKPFTTPCFTLLPAQSQRDAQLRPLVRIGVQASFPFAFPGNVTSERLLRPLRLAVYQVLGEPRVVETCLEWVEYSDAFWPEQMTRQWKFWGAAWDLENSDKGGKGGVKGAASQADDIFYNSGVHAERAAEEEEEGGVLDDWEEAEDPETHGGGEALCAEESKLVHLLAGMLQGMRTSEDRFLLYDYVSRIYHHVCGPPQEHPTLSPSPHTHSASSPALPELWEGGRERGGSMHQVRVWKGGRGGEGRGGG